MDAELLTEGGQRRHFDECRTAGKRRKKEFREQRRENERELVRDKEQGE